MQVSVCLAEVGYFKVRKILCYFTTKRIRNVFSKRNTHTQTKTNKEKCLDTLKTNDFFYSSVFVNKSLLRQMQALVHQSLGLE